MTQHHIGGPGIRRPLTLLLAAAVAVAGSLITLMPTTSAHAAPVCPDPAHPISTTRTPGGAVKLGTKKTQQLELTVYTDQGCTVTGATARLTTPYGLKSVTLKPRKIRDEVTAWEGKIAISPRKLRNSDAGGWPTTFTVTGSRTQRVTVDSQVLRASRVSFNAGPEPVRNGKISYRGKLVRASWNSHKYVGFGRQPIKIMRLFDEGEAELAAGLRTGASGRFKRTRPYLGAGGYRADFAGTSTTYPSVSKKDLVLS